MPTKTFTSGRIRKATVLAAVLLALAGCAGLPGTPASVSPCAQAEASYACQVQRYHDVSAP